MGASDAGLSAATVRSGSIVGAQLTEIGIWGIHRRYISIRAFNGMVIMISRLLHYSKELLHAGFGDRLPRARLGFPMARGPFWGGGP